MQGDPANLTLSGRTTLDWVAMKRRSLLPRLVASGLVFSMSWGLLLATAPVAKAQSTDVMKEARQNFQQALEFEQAKHWPEALKLFREVGGVRMTPQVRFHIALCEEKLGRLVAALGGYELALADAEGVGSDFRSDVETAISKLKERIPKLVIERGPGADAAAVELDGVTLGNTSIGTEVPVDPGPHNVTAVAKGYEDFSSTVEVEEGKTATLALELKRLPARKRSDGLGTGDDGGSSQVVPTRNWVAPAVAFGVGGAALLGAGAFYILRTGAVDNALEACGRESFDVPCVSGSQVAVNNQLDQARTYNVISEILFGAGLAGVGTGAVLLLVHPKSGAAQEQKPKEPTTSSKGNWHWAPVAPKADVGFSLVGRF